MSRYEASRTRCEHCGAGGADFAYKGHALCCECMSELTSWFLDGGMAEAPEQFDHLVDKASV
jgi:hypothetical protein